MLPPQHSALRPQDELSVWDIGGDIGALSHIGTTGAPSFLGQQEEAAVDEGCLAVEEDRKDDSASVALEWKRR